MFEVLCVERGWELQLLANPEPARALCLWEHDFRVDRIRLWFRKVHPHYDGNELFKSENMVSLTGYDQYKETLGQIFADMVELKNQMDQKESQPEIPQELTIDDIAKLVTDTVHVSLERENVSNLETVFVTEQHNSKKKLVKIMLKDSKEEKFFKVMMFPLHNGMIGKHTHDEVMIYSNAK